MRNGFLLVAIVVVAMASAIVGSAQEARTAGLPPNAPAQVASRLVFEADGLLDQKELVLVRPMIESETSVWLRARGAKVAPASLRARVYGLKVDVLYKDAEIGTAFLRRERIYHLGTRNDQIVVDTTYYYCNGFLSADVVKVSERSWSKYYDGHPGRITKLDTLAEAVRNGSGHQDAYDAVTPGGDLLEGGGEEQNPFQREVTWFSGKQLIDAIGVELLRSPAVGNRVSVRFVQ